MYYHPSDLLYQELWKQRLANIGFRVVMVRKHHFHQVWEIRLCANLAAQIFLLVSTPVPNKNLTATDLLCKQLRAQIRRIAEGLGAPIPWDCINVVQNGKAYFNVTFIWRKGKPGLLLKKEKPTEAFSFLIQSWLKTKRN
jgi:hypothetical protein